MVDNADPEILIDAIEARPCIWDVFNPDYHDRYKTRACWNEVAKIFHPDFDSLSDQDKNTIVLLAQRKWRNMRDSWVKDFRFWSNKSSTAKSSKRRKYIFFNRLSFLKKSVVAKTPRGVLPLKSRSDSDNSQSDDEAYFPSDRAAEALKIDSKALISAVEATPALWDATCEEYHDRSKMKDGWLNICRTFCPQFDDLQESDRIKLLGSCQKKWRNFRDSFVKDWRASQNPATRSLRRRKYIFYDRLSFLLKSIEWKMKINPNASLIEDNLSDELSYPDYELGFDEQHPYGEEEPTEYHEVEQKFNPNDLQEVLRPEEPQAFYPICSIVNSPQIDQQQLQVNRQHQSEQQVQREQQLQQREPPKPEMIQQPQEEPTTTQQTSGQQKLPVQQRVQLPPQSNEPTPGTSSSSSLGHTNFDNFGQSMLHDEDIAFFFSVLPTVRKFDDDTKFEFRMEVMKLVKKMKGQQDSSKFSK